MNEDTITVLIEAFTDIKVELEAVCLALQQKDVPRETITSLRGEVDEKAIRDEVRERLLPALFT
jgi:signal recognition particle GTPase